MMDWLTTAVFLAGSAFLTMAITFGGTVYDWNSSTEITFWALTGVFLCLTIFCLVLHPGVSEENILWPMHFLKMPVVMNLQLEVFLCSGIVLVSRSFLVRTGKLIWKVHDLSCSLVLSVYSSEWADRN